MSVNHLKPVFFDAESLDGLVDTVLSAHGQALSASRGLDGVPHDSIKRVESACASVCSFHPERYGTLERQAAELAVRIAKDHCFPDGNKRTGVIMAIVLMETYGHAVSCSQDDFIRAGLAAADGDSDKVMEALSS